MICPRCGELLVEDRFMDWTRRWYCMKCGEVHDSNTVQSHMVNEKNRLFPKSSEPEALDDEVHLGSESIIGQLAKIKNPNYSM